MSGTRGLTCDSKQKTHVQTDGQREREREQQAGRQADRQTDRQTVLTHGAELLAADLRQGVTGNVMPASRSRVRRAYTMTDRRLPARNNTRTAGSIADENSTPLGRERSPFWHGRPHIGANGVSWPPWKNGWKIKKRNMRKRACLGYILRAIRAGRRRERRYADHIFIQIYFRMHHFVVKFSKFSFRLRRQGGIDPLTKILRTPLHSGTVFRVSSSECETVGLRVIWRFSSYKYMLI